MKRTLLVLPFKYSMANHWSGADLMIQKSILKAPPTKSHIHAFALCLLRTKARQPVGAVDVDRKQTNTRSAENKMDNGVG